MRYEKKQMKLLTVVTHWAFKISLASLFSSQHVHVV